MTASLYESTITSLEASAAFEAAATLQAGAHGSVAAARRATLACGVFLQAQSRKQRRPPAEGSTSSSALNQSRTALFTLARQQAEQAPWQRWASGT